MQFASMRAGYENLWAKAKVLPQHELTLKSICDQFIANRVRYEAVEKTTGVPWWWIACVHMRESSCNFYTHLANGDPLDHKTVHVPAGRGPFATWEDGAIDALRYMGLHLVTDWSLPAALYQFERYNGWGYVSKGINSPYVWSFTDLYRAGKYVGDNDFSASAIDPQPGCAAMLNILLSLVPNLVAQVITMPTTAPAAPTPAVPTPVPASAITTNTAKNISTHILFGIGVAMSAAGFSAAHGVWDALTSSGFLGGAATSLLALGISHLDALGLNDATLNYADQLLTKIIELSGTKVPAQQSLLQQAAMMDPNATPAV